MSTRNIILFVFISIVCTIGMVFLLYATMHKPNALKNGFTRNIAAPNSKPQLELKLKDNGYYIAGHTEHHIYLGNISYPRQVLIIDFHNGDSSLVYLNYKPEKVYAEWRSMRLTIDSPYIYQSEGVSPIFFKGNLQELILDTFMTKRAYFTKAINISPSSFAVRAVKREAMENTVMKIQADSPYITRYDSVLKIQVDGIFDTDGQFNYNKKSGIISYQYFYRNQFIVLDTNLNVLHTWNTIDTNTVAKVSVAVTSETGKRMFSAPPISVNGTSTVNDSIIFIRSAMLADNEHTDELQDKNVIDRYAVYTGEYLGSFYIPKIHGKGIKEMCMVSGKILTVCDDYFAVFSIQPDFNIK